MNHYFPVYQILFPAAIAVYLVSCATITVNVYFPAEEVRQAYTNLEEEFLIDDESTDDKKNSDSKSSGNPDSRLQFSDEPVIRITKIVPLTRKIDLNIVDTAMATGDVTQRIETEIKKFPEVVQAFRERAARQSKINSLLDSGKVGESNKGLLVERDSLTGEEKSVMDAENSNRKTIIEGMAKAILKINNIESSQQNISKVYPEAAEQFATSRRDVARSGWKVQLPGGQWAVKK